MLPALRHSLALALGAVAAASLAACGSSAPSAGGSPTTPPTPPTAPPSSPSAATSSADAVAASGIKLDTKTFTIRAPQGWKRNKLGEITPTNRAADSPDSMMGINTIANCLGVDNPPSLAHQAKAQSASEPHVKQVANVTLGGQPWYHISGPAGSFWDDEFGAYVDGCSTLIEFHFQRSVSPAARQQVIEPVLASYELDD